MKYDGRFYQMEKINEKNTDQGCNHAFIKKPGIKCCKDKGHEGMHISYVEHANRSLSVFQWNDAGESPMPPKEYFKVFTVDYDKGHDARQEAMDSAIADARKTLPKGTVFEVRAKFIPKDTVQISISSSRQRDIKKEKVTRRSKMDKKWGVAWYCVPENKQPEGFEMYYQTTATEPLFKHDVDGGVEDVLAGYVLVARIEA